MAGTVPAQEEMVMNSYKNLKGPEAIRPKANRPKRMPKTPPEVPFRLLARGSECKVLGEEGTNGEEYRYKKVHPFEWQATLWKARRSDGAPAFADGIHDDVIVVEVHQDNTIGISW